MKAINKDEIKAKISFGLWWRREKRIGEKERRRRRRRREEEEEEEEEEKEKEKRSSKKIKGMKLSKDFYDF